MYIRHEKDTLLHSEEPHYGSYVFYCVICAVVGNNGRELHRSSSLLCSLRLINGSACMAGKLIELRGLPASGKSSLARKLIKHLDNTYRVNRDELRTMLFPGKKWKPYREKIVKIAQGAIIEEILALNCAVIVDDCNVIKTEKWKQFARNRGADYELRELKANIWECIEADAGPNRVPVGPAVICRMALQAGMIEFTKPVIIFDVDGTIADLSHRLHYIRNDEGVRRFDKFYNACALDTPFSHICHLASEFMRNTNYETIFLTGRPSEHSRATWDWITQYIGKPKYLFSRESEDYREDSIIKEEILRKLQKAGANVICTFDDRLQVIRMWERNSIPVVACQGGTIRSNLNVPVILRNAPIESIEHLKEYTDIHTVSDGLLKEF